MFVKNLLKNIIEYIQYLFTFYEEEEYFISPVNYCGFAKDRESFSKDRNNIVCDMRLGWEKAKQNFDIDI